MTYIKNIIASTVLAILIVAIPIVTTCAYCLHWHDSITVFGTLFTIIETAILGLFIGIKGE